MADQTRDPVSAEERTPAPGPRREAAAARLLRITTDWPDEIEGKEARPATDRLVPHEHWQPAGPERQSTGPGAAPMPAARPRPSRRQTTWADRALLLIEILAVGGLLATIVLSLSDLRRLRQDLWPVPTATRTPTDRQTPVAQVVPTVEATATPKPTATQPPTPATVEPTPVLLPGGRSSPTPSPARQTGAAVPTPAATPASPTGVRFRIPAIGVDAQMVEGDDWETLKEGIGHHPGSAWPGENGNVVVSAHNDIHGAIFKNLKDLQPGDVVEVYTPTSVYRYEVMFTRLVLPTEVSVMAPSRQPILTMITCYPPYMDTHRIVVTAKLVK